MIVAMKVHGLWQWHRALRKSSVVATSKVRWWEGGKELERADRLVSCAYHPMGYGGRVAKPYRPCDAIERCVRRFMRRFGIRRCVGEWNRLARRIADRCHARHSLHAVIVDENFYSRNAPVNIDDEHAELVDPRWHRSDVRHQINSVKARLDAIREIERRRRERLWKEIDATEAAIKAINESIRAASAALKEKL